MVVEVTVNTAGKLALLVLHELLESVASESLVLLMVNFVFLCAARITVTSSIKYPPLKFGLA